MVLKEENKVMYVKMDPLAFFQEIFFFLRLVENIVFCLKYPGKYFFFKEEKSLKLLAIYKILIYI